MKTASVRAPPSTVVASRPEPSGLAGFHRLAVTLVLGFASGLPLMLVGPALMAWVSMAGLSLSTIGYLSLVGVPYTFKFLWAPLMDRFEPPGLGRRRGWIVLTQLGVAGALFALSTVSPTASIRGFALVALCVAFLSASQDVVVDAYKADILPPRERGLGSSLGVLGYRFAMIVSGGLVLIWVDPNSAARWNWPEVYRFMAFLMTGAAVFSAIALPRVRVEATPSSVARRDLVGFLAVIAVVALGAVFTDRLGPPIVRAALGPLLATSAMATALQARWIGLGALLLGIAVTLPLAAWAARAARFETLLDGLRSYFALPGSGVILAFIVVYKLTDVFALSLITPFLLNGMGFGAAEVGLVNKVFAIWLTIGGALLGGALMLRLGLWRSLFLFGVLQAATNLGYMWLAASGKGQLPGIVIPAFNWGFARLDAPTPLDGGLLFVMAIENLTSGMGTAAFVAFLLSLCNSRFSATHYALLSAFASIGPVWVGPVAGVLAESIGWPTFFLISALLGIPSILLLWWLRAPIRLLEISRREPATA